MPKYDRKVTDENATFHDPSKRQLDKMARRVLLVLKKANIDGCLVKGAFRPTIEINEVKSKHSYTQYSITID